MLMGALVVATTYAWAALTEAAERYPNGYMRGADQFRRRCGETLRLNLSR
jgi:hypothetical protein